MMMNTYPAASQDTAEADQPADSTTSAGGNLTLVQYTQWLNEIRDQPGWRNQADREMDFVAGNQLDSELLRKMRELGLPPSVENLMGPAIESVCGFEAKTRTDWRLSADAGDEEGENVARALNYRLNQAERQSGADRAMSDAFRPMVAVGLGWVEVSRESDPFKFKYRVKAVHRNQIWWDWLAKESDLSDARYLVRRLWTDVEQAALQFPVHERLIRLCAGGRGWADAYTDMHDGSGLPSLANNAMQERGWSVEDMEWRDPYKSRVCLSEVWYRRWERVAVLRSPDGRVVEYNPNLASHVIAVAKGYIRPEFAITGRVYRSYWLGPHKLTDEASPYPHPNFPYVPFWGQREDRTGVPYGVARGMMSMQENVNATTSKIRWGLAAVRVERTNGAYSGTDAQLRRQVARVDADIVLDEQKMKSGGIFKVYRDFDLTEQQYRMLQDARSAIPRASGITQAFEGQTGTARSGVQENAQIEQTTQSLASLMDNFKAGRTQVGEMLMAMEIKDIGEQELEVVIKGAPPIPDRVVRLNQPASDPTTGLAYRTNDVQRTRLKVALEDVPTTSSFRAQQLAAMSEAFKAMPQQVQLSVLPHLLGLMDVPNKDEVIKAVQASQTQLTEEQVQQRIDQALKNAQYDLKARELDAKYNPMLMAAQMKKLHAEISKINGEAGKKFMELMFAGMQAAEVVTAVPQVAPVADALNDAALELARTGGAAAVDVPQLPGQGAQIVKDVKNPNTGVGFTPGAPGVEPTVDTGGGMPGDTTPLTPAQPASPFQGPNAGMTTMRPDSTGPQA